MVNLGYLPPTKEELEESSKAGYIFGTRMAGKAINPIGSWKLYLPVNEHQKNRYMDSNGCVIFGTQNAVETLAKFQWNEDWNKSERFTGAFANMTPQGTTPHAGAEAIRKHGLIPQELMPLTEVKTFEELWDKEMAKKFEEVGRDWLDIYKFNHDWVYEGQEQEALKSSPLGVSVYAWAEDNGFYYRPNGAPDNHWVLLIEDTPDYRLIFDSYPPYIKKLRPDFKFSYMKRYTLEKGSDFDWWISFINFWKEILHKFCG